MYATILAALAALATILAVVGKTASNEAALMSRPTYVGWALIVLAIVVMFVTTWKHFDDEKIEQQRFQNISQKADRLQDQLFKRTGTESPT